LQLSEIRNKMAQYINLKTIDQDTSDSIFEQIKPISGVCIFIDIVSSTELKYKKGVKEWIQTIKNTFGFISVLKGFQDHIIKSIGDEIMIFIPDDSFRKSLPKIRNPYNLLKELYATLITLKEFPVAGRYLNCKIAIH